MGFRIPDKMRALVLRGIGFENLEVCTIPVPTPNDNQMLARVDAAGICTSLIKLIAQGPDHNFLYGWDIKKYPIVLGDEGSVTLVQIGKSLREKYSPGERYVIQPAVDQAPTNFLERYRDNGRGIRKIAVGYTLPGHLAEYILITEEVIAGDCLLPIPNIGIPYAHAAIAEPMSCVISAQDHHIHLCQENGLSKRSVIKGLKKDGVTVVVGAGAMGRLHVELAMSYHPKLIIVVDLTEERLNLVEKLFSQKAKENNITLETIQPKNIDLKKYILENTGYQGADDVIIAVGSKLAIETATDYVNQGGVLNLFGGLKKGEEIVGFDTIAIHYKSINITGSSGGSPWDVSRTLELIANSEIEPGLHITRIGDLNHSIDFLKMIIERKIDGKAVVYPHHRTSEIIEVEEWNKADETAYLDLPKGEF